MTSGSAAFRLWTASDRDEPCSPVSRRGLMSTEPGTLTQRFLGDGRVRAWRGRSLDSTVDPHPGGGNLLAMNADLRGWWLVISSPSRPEAFPRDCCFTNQRWNLVRLRGQEERRLCVGVWASTRARATLSSTTRRDGSFALPARGNTTTCVGVWASTRARATLTSTTRSRMPAT